MKNVLKLAWAWVCSKFEGKPEPAGTGNIPEGITEADLDHAITIVDNIRNAMASPVAVIITDLIPSTIDDTIRQTLVNVLPEIAAVLTFTKGLLRTFDKKKVFNAVLQTVKESEKPGQDSFAHNMAAQILMVISGGKVNWSLAVQAVEYYFKNRPLKTV